MTKKEVEKKLEGIVNFEKQQLIAPLTLEEMERHMAVLCPLLKEEGLSSVLSSSIVSNLEHYLTVLKSIDLRDGTIAIPSSIANALSSMSSVTAEDALIPLLAFGAMDVVHRHTIAQLKKENEDLKKKVHHNDGHYGH